MNPRIAQLLSELGVLPQAGGNPLLDANPLLQPQPQQVTQPAVQPQPVAAPIMRAPDLSVAPSLYTWQAPQRTIRPDQVTATATGGVGASAGTPASSAPASLLASESGGNYAADNNIGYVGRYQFGEARLADAARALGLGTISPERFKADPALQNQVEQWHFADINNRIDNDGAASYIGATVAGVPITRDGLVAMAHLGGTAGMERFLKTGGAYDPQDAFGTSLSDYAKSHAGNTTTPSTQEAQMAPKKADMAAFLANAFGLSGGAGNDSVAGGGGTDALSGPLAINPTNDLRNGVAEVGNSLGGFLAELLGIKPANVGDEVPGRPNGIRVTGTATGGGGAGASGAGTFTTPANTMQVTGSATGGAGAGASGAGTFTAPARAVSATGEATGNVGAGLTADALAPLFSALGIATPGYAYQAGAGASGAGSLTVGNQTPPVPATSPTPTAPTTQIAATGTASAGTATAKPAPVNDADLAALMPDSSPEARAAAKKALTWQMIGVGLGQMSHGDRVDLSSVINSHMERQQVAQQRIAEIAMERQRRVEVAQQHGWSQEAAAAEAASRREQFDYETQARTAAEKAKLDLITASAAQTQRATADQLTAIGNVEGARAVMAADPVAGSSIGQQLLATSLTQNATNEAAIANDARDAVTAQQKATAKIAADQAANRTAAAEMSKMYADLSASPGATPEDLARYAKGQTALASIASGASNATVDDVLTAAGLKSSGTTINNNTTPENKERASYTGRRLDDYDAAKAKARPVLAATAGVMSQIRNGTLETGMLEEAVKLPLRQFTADLGLGENPTGAEQLVALTNQVAPTFHVMGSGSSSDIDLAGFIKASPSLGKSEETNLLMLSALENKAKQDVAKAHAAEKWASDHDFDIIGFDADWTEKQKRGEAPSDVYMADIADKSSSTAIVTAYKNGYIKDGDPVIVTENGVDTILSMDSDLRALLSAK